MSSVPPPSLPPRPELPEGVHRPEPAPAPPPEWERSLPLWAPFAIALGAFVIASVAYGVIVAVAGLSAGEAEDAPGPLLGATLAQDLLLIGGAVIAVRASVERDPAGALGIRRTPLRPA